MNKQTITIGVCVVAVLALGGLYYAYKPQFPANGADEKIKVDKPITMETQTPGLNIKILKEGAGEGVKSGQVAVVHYTGTLADGRVFDSSIPRGQTFPVNLGRGEVIKGWDLGLVGMKVGERRMLTIAPDLAYGPRGVDGVIPPNATLVFEVLLVEIR